jgi:hypothetical protein
MGRNRYLVHSPAGRKTLSEFKTDVRSPSTITSKSLGRSGFLDRSVLRDWLWMHSSGTYLNVHPMPLHFHRAVEKMEIWSVYSDGYSFVISYESPVGPGFHGRAGYLASWRPVYEGRGAIRITGSPFKTFDEAEAACEAMLKHLTSD